MEIGYGKKVISIEEINKLTGDLDELHKVTSGKYVLYHFFQELKKRHNITGLRYDEVAGYLLARILKAEKGITGELQELQEFLLNLCH